jgi:hypothetical protein
MIDFVSPSHRLEIAADDHSVKPAWVIKETDTLPPHLRMDTKNLAIQMLGLVPDAEVDAASDDHRGATVPALKNLFQEMLRCTTTGRAKHPTAHARIHLGGWRPEEEEDEKEDSRGVGGGEGAGTTVQVSVVAGRDIFLTRSCDRGTNDVVLTLPLKDIATNALHVGLVWAPRLSPSVTAPRCMMNIRFAPEAFTLAIQKWQQRCTGIGATLADLSVPADLACLILAYQEVIVHTATVTTATPTPEQPSTTLPADVPLLPDRPSEKVSVPQQRSATVRFARLFEAKEMQRKTGANPRSRPV